MYKKIKNIPVEKIALYTKSYSKTKLIAYLREEYGDLYPIVADQLSLLEKAKKKLPQWVDAGCLFTAKGLEQCSSQPLAKFKSGLITGNTLLDLSGGLGVDDVSFSMVFNQVISLDIDEHLNELVQLNLQKLNIKNVSRLTISAEDYLKSHKEPVEAIYVDADRRVKGNQKSALLSGASPDVQSLLPQLLKKSERIMLKLSPLIDITYLQQLFPNIEHIYVVGVQNEVKEVLVLLNNRVLTNKQQVTAVQLASSGEVTHQINGKENREPVNSTPSESWFYEPSNMVIKAGLSQALAKTNGLRLIAKNSHYMLGSQFIDGYFGRAFKVKHSMVFGKRALKDYLSGHQINKANVSVRNFISTVDEIRRTFNIADGGDDYLFLTTNNEGEKIFYHCVKH